MNSDEVSSLRVGDYLMPSGGPVNSSIRVIEINERGFRFRRINLFHQGEEFFLSRDLLMRSNWTIVPVGTQLPLL